MKCDNATEDGRCSLGLYGGRPSIGVCMICNEWKGKARGAGDVVEFFARATGIAAIANHIKGGDCGGCAKRRAALNAALPFTDEAQKDG
jgi:hypothetical protein